MEAPENQSSASRIALSRSSMSVVKPCCIDSFLMDVTYYTYRITAADSSKYYYGVSHVKVENASKSQCLNDGYWGTGGGKEGNKFFNWKSRHRVHLLKTIVGLFPAKELAYENEREIIGDLWKDDPNCLNSIPGGGVGGIGFIDSEITLQICEKHGEVKHQRGRCRSCISESSVSELFCDIHGLSKHRGKTCFKCRRQMLIKEFCSNHGETLHQNGACLKCKQAATQSLKHCSNHGETIHFGETCAKCTSQKSLKLANCEVHGETKFQGEKCCKCSTTNANSKVDCKVHGTSAAYTANGKCRKCLSQAQTTLKLCEKHGMSKHRSGSCQSCRVESGYILALCSEHGFVKHTKKTMTCRTCWKSQKRLRNKQVS